MFNLYVTGIVFNLYVIGIDYVQPSQECCLQYVLAKTHFVWIRQSGKWSEVDVSQKGG